MPVIWKFKTRNFTVKCVTASESFDTRCLEQSLVDEIKTKLKSKELQCFQVEMQVKHRVSKRVLGCAYLGQCIYEDPAQFIDHRGMNEGNYGSYFSQMVREATAEARENLRKQRIEAENELKALNQGIIKEVTCRLK